jgi:hypothetical protein
MIPVDPGHTNPGPAIVLGVAGASFEMSLKTALLDDVLQAGREADNQMLPCPKLLAAFTVTVLVPAPEVMVTPLGIDQL